LEQLVFNASASHLGGSSMDGVLQKHVLLEALDLQERIEASSITYHPSIGFYTQSQANSIAGSVTLSLKDICFSASTGKCLVHSALEFWHSDKELLATDSNIQHTLSNASALSSFGTPIPLHSVFGGVKLSGKKHEPLQITGASSIVITYFLEEHRVEEILALVSPKLPDLQREAFISQIWDQLWKAAIDGKNEILSASSAAKNEATERWSAWRSVGEIKHLYYVFGEPEDILSVEVVIVILTYIIVFFYISLVLGQVELVKSKFGLGLGAVIMVFSSLTMSVGLTSWMGVTTSLVPWEVLPFLIIAIGVENIRVMTNAVVTSAIDLPVKERVGIGLSKVGAKMTFSLTRELCLLVLVSLINVPALQEFCLFATVAVVIDFMMQITFFTTILSIDIRRLELTDLHKLHTIKSRKQSANPTSKISGSNGNSNRWGAIIMVLIMTSIGLGIYGTSSNPGMNEVALPPMGPMESPIAQQNHELVWENSMSVTADVLWDVINPSRADRYVEIRPPVCITVFSPQDTTPSPLSDNPTQQQEQNQPLPPLPPILQKEKWTITIDNYSFEIPRSVFIVVFVGLMVLICLGVIMLSSLVFYLVAPIAKSSKSKKGAELQKEEKELRDYVAEVSSTAFKNAQVLSLVGSPILDIEFLGSSSDGTVCWTCGDGLLHFWNCRTSRKVVIGEGCSGSSRLKKSGDGVSCFRLMGQVLVVGTFSGVVRVFDTYDGKLLGVFMNKGNCSTVYDVTMMEKSGDLVAIRFDGSLDFWSIPTRLLDLEESFETTATKFSSSYLQGVPTCLVGNAHAETLFGGNKEGMVKRISPNSNNSAIVSEVVSQCSSISTSVAYDLDLDIIATGSENGDITLHQLSTRKEILFIKSKPPPSPPTTSTSATTSQRSSMDLPSSSRPSFESDTSSVTNNNTSDHKKSATTASRVSPLLEGHSGEITFLKVLRKPAPANPTVPFLKTTNNESTDTFLVVSCGMDSIVNVWEISINNGGKQSTMSIHSCTLVKSVRQLGCVVATCYENMLVGARKRNTSSIRFEQPDSSDPGLRNRRERRSSKLGDVKEEIGEGWWEVWVLDLTLLFGGGNCVDDETDLSFIKIGNDTLSGVSLDTVTCASFQNRKDVILNRALAMGVLSNSQQDDSGFSSDDEDDEWIVVVGAAAGIPDIAADSAVESVAGDGSAVVAGHAVADVVNAE
ncbi:UNVERIFIED_CONTAM: hypothetical protein HDU68_012379, partial [Siphonaria sp. JEL0065]